MDMKAIITKKYGSSDVLEIAEVEKPLIKDHEILVKVKAFSVNPVDWKVRKGLAKIFTGLKPPLILGGDFSGIIDQVGNKVKGYKSGDEVFGLVNAFKGGAYAEYVRASEKGICFKPQNFSFEEAASTPIAALASYLSLYVESKIEEGKHVMINGCSSSVGIFAVQLAKAINCEITGVCSTRNIDFAKKIGVDNILDYTKEKILTGISKYDIFLDAVGNQKFRKVRKVLKPRGTYITTLPRMSSIVVAPIMNIFSSKKSKTVMVGPSTESAKGLQNLKKLAENNKLLPIIEKIYNPDEIREAHKLSETGRVVGKLVINCNNDTLRGSI